MTVCCKVNFAYEGPFDSTAETFPTEGLVCGGRRLDVWNDSHDCFGYIDRRFDCCFGFLIGFSYGEDVCLVIRMVRRVGSSFFI